LSYDLLVLIYSIWNFEVDTWLRF